ncbi:MAG: Crp/Fnr family transcriptional regulator [Bilifractor sp.]|jgi:CRP-like cAMP-binding protein
MSNADRKTEIDKARLSKTLFFRNLTGEEIDAALRKLRVSDLRYKKGAFILLAGNTTKQMGMVLEGSVTIESNDMWGNRTILSHVGPGQLFAETYALLNEEPLLVDVVANENSRILFLNIHDLKKTAADANPWALKLLTNLLTVTAHKNLVLSDRSFHTAAKTIRGKVLSYLNSVALKKGSRSFDIPFDRQQLADYLNVDRTALSKELGKMKNEGLISFEKNNFEIHDAS